MNKTLMAAGLAVILGACSSSKKSDVAEGATPNPFFAEYTTPFGVPPFDQIEVAHYKPALLKGMEEQSKEIEAIVANPDAPTFENTIVALDQSGELLTKVMYAFGGQSSVNTTDEIQELERELYPLLSKHSDDISLNTKLFARVKSVYENQASFHLDKEQKKLLEETYKSFVRGGANLPEDKQAKLRELNEKISMLQLTFGQNTLKETNAFQLVIDNKEDLSGLPEDVIVKAAQTAQENGLDGKWVFTLHNPSVMPFLQYADKRDLREKIFKAYTNRGNNNNENDNKEVVKQLVAARLEKARLMGYEDYAAFVLEENMAKNEKNVYDLLDKIWPSALAKAKEVLSRYKEALEQGKAARTVTFETKDEQKIAHDLFLLTNKPVMYVCNVDDNSAVSGNKYVDMVREAVKDENAEILILAAKTESEIAEFETYEERQMFLQEIGLEESGVSRLIRAAYSLLNLETYFTAGPQEVRAWTYLKGSKAPQCAGIIHTDFEKGFIRAEVIKYDDYIALGSENACKEAGKMYIEGKEYVVQDGDIMHFRFNV